MLVWIDGENLSLKDFPSLVLDKILENNVACLVYPFCSSDNGDRAGIEESIQLSD